MNTKIGTRLKENPLGETEVANLVISLTKNDSDLDPNNKQLKATIKYIEEQGYKIHDKLITENLCLLLIECNLDILYRLANLDLVENIDRRSEIQLN